ncbi:hypothetical protein M407DRAFT_18394 [Tulasnella calospora MUT 4182]|uniref:Fungal-type protein kinase domain-containing protein n=1 Tax=Tulasnella calospora MUT 4182 TaxID=1051891 RepID=A0A0C3QTR3_9AGAM|nr:hypothetical protein M407DRAFT_18394 [Tulasnella calospora MUT 4182]
MSEEEQWDLRSWFIQLVLPECWNFEPSKRPTMEDAVREMEFTLREIREELEKTLAGQVSFRSCPMQPQARGDSSIQRPQTPPYRSSPSARPPHEAPQPLSTPRRSGTPRSTTNVTAHRSEVLNQMKDEVVCCDTWSDFHHYLPATGIAKKDMVAAVKALKRNRHLVRLGDQNLQFTAFPTKPSLIGAPNEKSRYKALIKICEVLGKLQLQNGRTASCKLIQKPNSLSSGETPGANFIPDAYLELEESTMPPHDTSSTKKPIADMAVPSEYKTLERDVLDNRKKLLGGATYCMNDDARRMHIYGITIEDSNMTVWYFSRSHSAKSPAFDFTKYPRRYIRVMLSFLFATKRELGYDPTIQRRLDSGPAGKTLCYVYKVGDRGKRYFKTQGAIFEHRSLCATGRATRVWKVVEVRSFNDLRPLNSSTLVLKDVWLDSQSKTECQNLDAIFEKLEELAKLLDEGDGNSDIFNGLDKKSEADLKECLKERSWGQYFLTKVCDWQGFESKSVSPTAKPDSTLFNPPTPAPTRSSYPYSDQSRSTAAHATDLVEVAQNRPLRDYCPKRQYRVVFKEVCEALHHVQRLEDVVIALRDSVFALKLMFLAGWVHRDISSGNIYACRSQENGTDGAQVRGILADLEYAKQFDPEGARGSSDRKTGTAFFMAIEIQSQYLIYRETSGLPSPDEDETRSDPETSTGVIHNFEHDMESIFWLFLWILLVRFPPKRTAEQKSKFAGAVSTIFQDTSKCSMERLHLFTDKNLLHQFLNLWLNPDLAPIIGPLLRLRKALTSGYDGRKLNFGDRASYAQLYLYLDLVFK